MPNKASSSILNVSSKCVSPLRQLEYFVYTLFLSVLLAKESPGTLCPKILAMEVGRMLRKGFAVILKQLFLRTKTDSLPYWIQNLELSSPISVVHLNVQNSSCSQLLSQQG